MLGAATWPAALTLEFYIMRPGALGRELLLRKGELHHTRTAHARWAGFSLAPRTFPPPRAARHPIRQPATPDLGLFLINGYSTFYFQQTDAPSSRPSFYFFAFCAFGAC